MKPLSRARLLPTLLLLVTSGCAQFSPFGSPLANDPQIQRADFALLRKDLLTAQAQLDAFVKRDPTNATLYTLAARHCLAGHAWDLAIHYAELGLQHAARADASVRVMLYTVESTAWYNLGRPQKAVDAAQAGYAVDPKDSAAMNLLGYTYAVIPVPDKLGEALNLTRQAVELAKEHDAAPDDVAIYLDSVGWVEYQQGATDKSMYARAFADLSRAAGLIPSQYEVQYHLGMAAMKLAKYRDAVVALERSVRLNPDYPAAQEALKEAHRLAPAEPEPSMNVSSGSPPPPVMRASPGIPGAQR